MGKYLTHNAILSQNYRSNEQNKDMFHIPLYIPFRGNLMMDMFFQNRKLIQKKNRNPSNSRSSMGENKGNPQEIEKVKSQNDS